jgi:hypothetical protein
MAGARRLTVRSERAERSGDPIRPRSLLHSRVKIGMTEVITLE